LTKKLNNSINKRFHLNRVLRIFIYFISVIGILIGIGLSFNGIGAILGIPIIIIFVLVIRKVRKSGTNNYRNFRPGTNRGFGGGTEGYSHGMGPPNTGPSPGQAYTSWQNMHGGQPGGPGP
jgi:hypothetical protein